MVVLNSLTKKMMTNFMYILSNRNPKLRQIAFAIFSIIFIIFCVYIYLTDKKDQLDILILISLVMLFLVYETFKICYIYIKGCKFFVINIFFGTKEIDGKLFKSIEGNRLAPTRYTLCLNNGERYRFTISYFDKTRFTLKNNQLYSAKLIEDIKREISKN
jgi:hypothetical protein